MLHGIAELVQRHRQASRRLQGRASADLWRTGSRQARSQVSEPQGIHRAVNVSTSGSNREHHSLDERPTVPHRDLAHRRTTRASPAAASVESPLCARRLSSMPRGDVGRQPGLNNQASPAAAERLPTSAAPLPHPIWPPH